MGYGNGVRNSRTSPCVENQEMNGYTMLMIYIYLVNWLKAAKTYFVKPHNYVC